tara:strand:- start:1328 stop:1540 length:213 start_codon:yes stop_codon:yes gene_type:complete
MINFLLVMKVCSVLDGTCLPEREVSYHDTWFECARAGTVETLVLMDAIGEDLINNNKLYITYGCRASNEA